MLRLAKIFFRDHKPSLTLLLQQVVKGNQNVRSPPWAYTEREYGLSRTHCEFPYPFLNQEALFYSPDSFLLAYRIKVAFKLRNIAKLGGGETVVPVDCTL